MGNVTHIGWTATILRDGRHIPGATFNPWRGCTKVSQGCKNCYAEQLGGRNRKTLGEWGPKGTRVIASGSMWNQPMKWNHNAAEGICPLCEGRGYSVKKVVVGKAQDGLAIKVDVQTPCLPCSGTGKLPPYRRRVFCASLADVFEAEDTMPEAAHAPVKAARRRLFHLAQQTPHLDWLFLTKRPENIPRMLKEIPHRNPPHTDLWTLQERNPKYSWWFGTSVETEEHMERVERLQEVPAARRFISCEPLLGPLDFSWMHESCSACLGVGGGCNPNQWDDGLWTCDACGGTGRVPIDGLGIDWIIVGGESGPADKARPMNPEWAKAIRGDCKKAHIPFFFKQHGAWLHESQFYDLPSPMDPDTWDHLPSSPGGDDKYKYLGKERAGRLLDGQVYDEFPEARY